MSKLSRVRVLVLFAVVFSVLGALTGGGTAAAAEPTAPPGTPTATAFGGTPTVGPLFEGGLGRDHACTASIVASPGHNLLLAAAHCVSGTAAGWLFAPGYVDGRTPYGVWTVTHAYVDPRWSDGQDPRYDYAILQVADRPIGGREVGVQDVAGANVLGPAPRPGEKVTDVAYNGGIDDRPVRCATTVYSTDGYPSFNCHGFVGGSSGSPWLAAAPGTGLTLVQGLIGGLHQGGCYEYTSYSSAFRPAVYVLIGRATSGLHPDTVPAAGSDGC